MKGREFIVVLLLGILIGLGAGYYIGHKESNNLNKEFYQVEIKRLQIWNDLLLKTALQIKK